MIKGKLVNAIAESSHLSKEDTIILQYGLKILAPVEAENKTLSEKKAVNHRKSIGFILILDLAAIVSKIYGLNFFYTIADASAKEVVTENDTELVIMRSIRQRKTILLRWLSR